MCMKPCTSSVFVCPGRSLYPGDGSSDFHGISFEYVVCPFKQHSILSAGRVFSGKYITEKIAGLRSSAVFSFEKRGIYRSGSKCCH